MITRAFSLVELLVVVAVIGVLAGLILPATSLVRRSAQTATCAAHLRQLGLATQAYASDLGGVLVAGQRYYNATSDAGLTPINNKVLWFEMLAPYLETGTSDRASVTGAVRRCPAWPTQAANLGVTSASPATDRSLESRPGYGINYIPQADSTTYNAFPNGQNATPNYAIIFSNNNVAPTKVYRLAGITLPGRRCLIADSPYWHFGNVTPGTTAGADSFYFQGANQTGEYLRRHGDRLNVLFFDGHVQLLANTPWKNGNATNRRGPVYFTVWDPSDPTLP